MEREGGGSRLGSERSDDVMSDVRCVAGGWSDLPACRMPTGEEGELGQRPVGQPMVRPGTRPGDGIRSGASDAGRTASSPLRHGASGDACQSRVSESRERGCTGTVHRTDTAVQLYEACGEVCLCAWQV